MHRMDVMTIFLRCELGETIYTEIPDGMKSNASLGDPSGIVSRLIKSIYRLKQSP